MPRLKPLRGGRSTVTLRTPGVVTAKFFMAFSPSTRLMITGRSFGSAEGAVSVVMMTHGWS